MITVKDKDGQVIEGAEEMIEKLKVVAGDIHELMGV